MEKITDQDLKRNNWKWRPIDKLHDGSDGLQIDPLYKTIKDVNDTYLTDANGNLVSDKTIQKYLNSYEALTPYLEQLDNTTDLWYKKLLLHRLNLEFNRQVDHFFLGGWTSPSLIAGAFNPYGDNSNTSFAERLFLGTGNTGIVSKNFAENHPYWSVAANLGFDVVAPSVIKGIGYVTKPEVVSNVAKYTVHPTYKTYYHGSPYPFDIKNFYRGTEYDVGLHAGDKKIALSMSGPHEGVVYKFRAPRPTAESIDIGANDYRHLSRYYVVSARSAKAEEPFNPSYLSYAGDRLRLKLLNEKGALPTVKGNKLFTENDVVLNLRNNFPNVKKHFQKEADDIVHAGEETEVHNRTLLAGKPVGTKEVNTKAADLLSKAGYKVVKYVNANPFERPYHTNRPYYSYFITDPDVIQVMLPWPKVNFSTPLKLGAINTELNIINNKE